MVGLPENFGDFADGALERERDREIVYKWWVRRVAEHVHVDPLNPWRSHGKRKIMP